MPHHPTMMLSYTLPLLVSVNAGQRLTPYVMRKSSLSLVVTVGVALSGIRKTGKAGAGADGVEA